MQSGRKGFPAVPLPAQAQAPTPLPPSQLSESNRRIISGVPEGPPKRVYQLWKGNNRFFLGGRLIFGPDARSVLLTVCLIVVPVILFLVFVSQRLVDEFHHGYGDVIVAVAVIFTIYVLLLLLITSSRDPGIIPRNKHPPEPEEDATSNGTGGNCRGPTLPPTKDVMVNGITVKVKYCQTCMLYRLPRCSHCSICNNCVERFDHHCPWVGQCIGKRNYRFFFMFVSSTTILCLYVFGFCWVNLKKIMVTYHCNLWKALLESPVSGILILYTFVAVWFVGGLTAFHLYLISTNQTTYENFRYRYDRNMNPYNLGCVWNFKEIFFSGIPASKHDFQAVVKDEMGLFNPPSIRMSNVLSPDAAKRSVDLEMGMKRQTVAVEELEDIQSQIDSVGGLERSGTQPAHASSGRQGGHWEITQDLQALAAELGMQHEPPATVATGVREKITRTGSSNS